MPVFIDGHHLITPTSVAKTGTGSTATINTNGSVTFSSCATLSLNGVFSSTYDNYMVMMRGKSDSADNWLRIKLRVAGVDGSSDYAWQRLVATSTTIVGERQTSQTTGIRIGWLVNYTRSGYCANLYGPYLAQPTAFRIISAPGEDNARVEDYAGTHSRPTSYDGFSLISDSSNLFSGLVCVYGAVQ